MKSLNWMPKEINYKKKCVEKDKEVNNKMVW